MAILFGESYEVGETVEVSKQTLSARACVRAWPRSQKAGTAISDL